MKLWLKQTLLALLIILISVSACLYYFVATQTNSLLDSARNDGNKNMNAFLEHLSTLDSAGIAVYGTDSTTKIALIQYTFATYARILQNSNSTYSLVKDGVYLYNNSQNDPRARLPMNDDTISMRRIVMIDEKPWLLMATVCEVLSTRVIIYFSQDITSTYLSIDNLTRSAQTALLCCLVLSGVILPLVLRRTLNPLRRLTHVSEQIANGRYALRSGLRTDDEVGELSRSFDCMSETVEQKILTLKDTAHRRELLLGALTHEMKTPMTAIIGFSDSLLSMPLNEERRMEAAHEIHEAALRIERLSQKMMQMISITDSPILEKRKISIDALFAQTQKNVMPMLAEKQQALEVERRLKYVEGDGDLLVSLLVNLVDNASKASDKQKLITMSAYVKGSESCLQVKDKGSGIPSDKIPLVIEPFYRVDKARSRKYGGVGLGLALCQLIANAHGGRLEIESKLGYGTMVRVYLPMNAQEEGHEDN